MSDPKPRVLFLCTGNTARSQMAEALLRYHAGDHIEAHSAGLEPSVLNPLTVKVLAELGIDTSAQYSKSIKVYLGKMSFLYMVTVCAQAEAQCPSVFPGVIYREHWDFEDPAKAEGSEDQKLAKFRDIRDQIDQKIRAWLPTLKLPNNHLAST
ncbi:MAG: arsenate reductase ArsC [Anaerolineae bacterium]|nr:arsenate reductase ArsC [Anaerolineae bacterium]